MGQEEQKEEREVLDSIFPDEITDISDHSYRISISLDIASQDENDRPPPPLLLTVTYPDSYPDEPPLLDLSSPPNAPRYPDLDVQDDKHRLLSSLESTIDESLGMAMVFTLVSSLKENAEGLISERRAARQAVKDVEAAKAEEEENRKFHGTAVTRESFLIWREKFRAEMEADDERRREEKEADDKKRRVKAEEDKLTGRDLWERGLVGKLDDDEEGEDDALKGMQGLTVEE